MLVTSAPPSVCTAAPRQGIFLVPWSLVGEVVCFSVPVSHDCSCCTRTSEAHLGKQRSCRRQGLDKFCSLSQTQRLRVSLSQPQEKTEPAFASGLAGPRQESGCEISHRTIYPQGNPAWSRFLPKLLRPVATLSLSANDFPSQRKGESRLRFIKARLPLRNSA